MIQLVAGLFTVLAFISVTGAIALVPDKTTPVTVRLGAGALCALGLVGLYVGYLR